jgi:hypothetical protein
MITDEDLYWHERIVKFDEKHISDDIRWFGGESLDLHLNSRDYAEAVELVRYFRRSQVRSFNIEKDMNFEYCGYLGVFNINIYELPPLPNENEGTTVTNNPQTEKI